MKKAVLILAFVFIVSLFQGAYAKENIIYGVELNNGNLNLISDYREDFQVVKDSNGVYFDIKNAKLSENYKTEYNGDLNIVSQQIGSKVRIYINGINSEKIIPVSVSKKVKPFDYTGTTGSASLLIILSALALKTYSVTMKYRLAKEAVISPVETAINLNRKLYLLNNRKLQEIALSKKQDVAEFQYAKDKKNVKIAI